MSYIKETARNIYEGNLNFPFFIKVIASLKEVFIGEPLAKEKTISVIEELLCFTNHKKELIWYLTYDEGFFNFYQLVYLLKNDSDYFKGFSKKNFIKARRVIDNFIVHDNTINECILFTMNLSRDYVTLPKIIKLKENLFYGKTFDQIEATVIKLDKILAKDLVKPLDIILPTRCYEITSEKQLIEEADIMKNCLSDYSEEIKSKTVKLFHIEVGSIIANLELRKDGLGGIFISQCKGPLNCSIRDADLWKIAFNLRKELNDNHTESVILVDDIPNLNPPPNHHFIIERMNKDKIGEKIGGISKPTTYQNLISIEWLPNPKSKLFS